jgi:hypothetical protein
MSGLFGVFGRVTQWSRPLFGEPALLLRADDQWVIGGPLEVGPRTWYWVAYSGPAPARRLLASANSRMTPRALPHGRDTTYAGFASDTTYYMLDRDEEGMYVTAYARVLPLGWSLDAVHDELASAADWLRRARQFPELVNIRESA